MRNDLINNDLINVSSVNLRRTLALLSGLLLLNAPAFG